MWVMLFQHQGLGWNGCGTAKRSKHTRSTFEVNRTVYAFALFLTGLCAGSLLLAYATDPAPQTSNGYLLGPEDQLSIHVVDLDDVSDKPFRVDPSGFVDLPLAGRIHVSGFSLNELR